MEPTYNKGILRIMVIVCMTLLTFFSFIMPLHSQQNDFVLNLTDPQQGPTTKPVPEEPGVLKTSVILGLGIGSGINHTRVTGTLPQVYKSGKIGIEISLVEFLRFRVEAGTFSYSHSALSREGLLFRDREGFALQGQTGFMTRFSRRRIAGGFLIGGGVAISRDSGTHLVAAYPTANTTLCMAFSHNDTFEARVMLPLEYSFRNEAPVFNASIVCEIAFPVSGEWFQQKRTERKGGNGN